MVVVVGSSSSAASMSALTNRVPTDSKLWMLVLLVPSPLVSNTFEKPSPGWISSGFRIELYQ